MRLDKWLWAARFYRTRSLAQQAIEQGRVLVSDARAKVARDIDVGAELRVATGDTVRVVIVRALSDQRGPAPVAQQLYEETAESRVTRELQAEQRRYLREPAREIVGRPTKRDRRELERARGDRFDDADLP